jgi:hypothetical protein
MLSRWDVLLGIVPVEEGGNWGSGIYQLLQDFCATQRTD